MTKTWWVAQVQGKGRQGREVGRAFIGGQGGKWRRGGQKGDSGHQATTKTWWG